MKKIIIIPIMIYIFSVGFFLSGCTGQKIDTGQVSIKPKAILNLPLNASQKEIFDQLGTLGKHQFSVIRNGDTYTLTSFDLVLDSNQKEITSTCWMLLKNRTFWKFIPVIPFTKIETYPYMGTTATRRASWEVKDNSRIDKCLEAKAITAEALRKKWDKKRAALIQTKQKGESNVLPAFLLTGFFSKDNLAKIQRDYDHNKRLMKKYDPYKIRIGDSEETIERQFGKPKTTANLSDGRTVKLYGENVELGVNYAHHFSWIAIQYENNQATKILSHGFLNEKWKNGKDIEIKTR
jgi:hypothetical protein